MSILIDHCVPRRYYRLLKEWGYDAHLLVEHLAADSEDDDLIAYVKAHDFVFLTVDKDFSDIVNYPPENYEGIIVLRYQWEDEAELDVALKTMLNDLYREKLRATLAIGSPGRYRTRRSGRI